MPTSVNHAVTRAIYSDSFVAIIVNSVLAIVSVYLPDSGNYLATFLERVVELRSFERSSSSPFLPHSPSPSEGYTRVHCPRRVEKGQGV